jgi:DNA-binding GntR family transcriptional regulator
MSANSSSHEETDPNQKRPLKEDVSDFLHENIISGKYKPGEWLRQEDIAKQLDVSMTPVREALDLLVASGLAERVPYRGVRVHEIVVKDVVEAYGMRLYLEVAISQEAAKHITPEQIQSLERTLDEMKKHETLNEMSKSRQLSRDFHSAIAAATGNDMLIRLYSVVSNAFPDWLLYEALFRRPEILPESMTDMHDEHVAIVAALKNGDGMSAALRSVEHVMESGKWIEKYLTPPIPAELLREKEEQILFLLQSQTS